jgi:cation diffusion facilitator family transporter
MAVICKQCYWCAEHVGNINLWANFGLFIVKIIGGILGRSQALFADALHSISDIIVALLLVVGLKITGAPPDEDHQWGHGHIEFIVSAIIGVLLLFAALTITVVSVVSIFEGTVSQPSILAVWAALISIVVNELMFRHSLCIGMQMNSPAMIANAWENRADVYSSAAALVGVFGARLGFAFLDPVAAILVGFMIAKSAVSTLVVAIGGITDRSVKSEVGPEVESIVAEEKAVKNIGKLRARKIGQKNWVDLEINLEPEIKVVEAKEIVKRLDGNIIRNIETIGGTHIIPRVEAAK